MATKVSICNRALASLGVRNRIASMSEDSEPARKCNLILDSIIEEVLRAYPWNCATDRASLAQSSASPAFGYAYKYALPNDCLRVIGMEYEDSEYKIEGRFLLTDETEANIIYIKKIDDVNTLDILCRAAISARLAAELAIPLTNSNSIQEAMWQLYSGKLTEAIEIDAQEETPGQWKSESWIDERA